MMQLSELEKLRFLQIITRYDNAAVRLRNTSTSWFASSSEKEFAQKEHEMALEALYYFLMELKAQGR